MWNGTKHFTAGAWRYGDANRYVAENLDSFNTLYNCFGSAGNGSILTSTVDNVGVSFRYLNLGTVGSPDEDYRLFINWSCTLYGALGGATSMTVSITDVFGNVIKPYTVTTLTTFKNFGLEASVLYTENINPGFIVNAVCNVGSSFVIQNASWFVAPLT